MEVFHKVVILSSNRKNNNSLCLESPYRPIIRNKSQSSLISFYKDENIKQLFTPKYKINKKKQREPYTVHLNKLTNIKLPCIKKEKKYPKKIFEKMPINPFLRPKNMKRIKLLDTSFLKNGSDLFKNRINAEKIDLEYHSKKNPSSFSMPEINPEQFQEAQCISNEYIKSKLLYE